ncbi:MAG: molybdopterin oxidoreductase family protein [Gemmatimonadota bacterium]|nr:molybdopterin oxidoreductase family protein [Gemmatimonadota bacterium]
MRSRRRKAPIAPGIDDFRSTGAGTADEWRTDQDDERQVPTHCCFCGVQCGMYLRVDGRGRVFGVEPRHHDINKGKLCPKGVVAYQQVNHPDRLTFPLMRDSRDAPLRRASWDEALDRVVAEIGRIQKSHGRDAFGVYSGSSLTTEKTYLMGKFARVALGTRHIDYNGRLCMVSAAAANKKAFGIDRAANPWADMLETDVILVAGANVGECFPVAMQYFWGARDRGAKLITVDPRQTPLARTADVHVPLRPGTDAAFFNGVLHAVIREGLIDEDFIAARTNDFEAVRRVVTAYDPARVGEICGLDPALIERVAQLWGGAERAMAFHARGIEHHVQGVDNCLTIINLVLASGQIGRPGAGYGTITGQGNGQGGREHGQKSDQLPGQRMITDPAARAHIAEFWRIDEAELPGEGTSAVEMVSQMGSGEIKGLIGICNNPFVSMPDREQIERDYAQLEFHCQIDFFLSETATRADVVLPGTVWAEDEGVTTNAEGRVVKHNKAAEPPGEVRTDWWIVCEIARRLGRHADKFAFDSAEEIFEELRGASKGGNADYSGITYARLDETGGIFWPCPSEDHPGTPRLFEERFYTPDGRAAFHPVEWHPPAEDIDGGYPLRLTTGRTVAQYLSGNQTRRLGALVEQTPRPWIEVHPSLGFANGDAVTVTTRRGSTTLPALVTETIRSDTVFIPYHWAGAVAANLLTINALDPTSKIPEYKVCACRVERGSKLTPVPVAPVPPGTEPYADARGPIGDTRPPTMPQGRGTSER